jgi:hypothetical protein
MHFALRVLASEGCGWGKRQGLWRRRCWFGDAHPDRLRVKSVSNELTGRRRVYARLVRWSKMEIPAVNRGGRRVLR